eukprot:5723889-Lingulodinium_polyedra.AAC.1
MPCEGRGAATRPRGHGRAARGPAALLQHSDALALSQNGYGMMVMVMVRTHLTRCHCPAAAGRPWEPSVEGEE